jgi:hypothetical protein
VGSDGTEDGITSDPPRDPLEAAPNDPLFSSCDNTVATLDGPKYAVLIDCGEGPDSETGPLDCDWWRPPARPASAAALRERSELAAAARRFADGGEAARLRERAAELSGTGD